MRRNRSPRDWMRFRFLILGLATFVAFGVVLLQAYRIQIQHGKKLREEVLAIYKREVILLPVRGNIFDRKGEDLAISIPADSIYGRPAKVRDRRAAASRLAPLLGMDRADLRKKLDPGRPFVWLKRQVVPTVSARVRAIEEPGIGVIQETRRFYPNLELASHLIGFLGVDGQGLNGLEYQYDEILRGKKGRMLVDIDALGRVLASDDGLIVARQDGNHLVLTIHKEIQHVVEQHLLAAVEATKARGGMAVVLDPRTGEILAMANVPRFNPNVFSRYPEEVWRNRAVTDLYEPGSTLKPLIVAAALEEKVFTPSDIVFCENGSYRVHNRVIHDVEGNGWLTLRGILLRSSNIGAAKVGLSLGADRLYRYLAGFGFGHETGVELPGEAAGTLRPPRSWSPVDLATISFGQGISGTALQLTSAFAALANGGHRMRPYVVKEILDAQGNTLRRQAPEDLGPVVSPETARRVNRMLVAVVREGTGSEAAIEGVTVAGKTGTSQKPNLQIGGYQEGKYLASFVGFLPAEDPRLCISVVLDEPQGHIYGGRVAAPAFRQIAVDAMGILGIFPKGPKESLLARGPQ